MLFNSLPFVYFCAVVFLVYWLLPLGKTAKNFVLLAASAFFYCWLYIKPGARPGPSFFLPLYLLAITVLAYTSGRWIDLRQSPRGRKRALVISLVFLASSLAFLKYSNFIAETLHHFSLQSAPFSPLKLLIPVGISFYTFTAIGYVVDIYRKKILPEKNVVTFSSYICFFPHLLSGPIATATEVLPQFQHDRKLNFRDIEDGAGQIIWGLFKKLVIADNIALAANYCFAHYSDNYGSTLWLGVTLFGFQLYADFSGYSDMARGIARLFGIDIIQNFRMPFFSRNPGEFWRRWHISLMRWLKDYIYIPLGGRSSSLIRHISLQLFVFLFSGLWHGASWNFVCWGLLNGIYFVPYIVTHSMERYKEVVAAHSWLPRTKELMQMFITFNLINLAWVFFKADTFAHATGYFSGMFSKSLFSLPPAFIYKNLKWCAMLVSIEWVFRRQAYVLDTPAGLRWTKFILYSAVVLMIVFWHKQQSLAEYYYFKF